MNAAFASDRHPHEPEIPPALDAEGRCLVCGLLVEINELREALHRCREDFHTKVIALQTVTKSANPPITEEALWKLSMLLVPSLESGRSRSRTPS